MLNPSIEEWVVVSAKSIEHYDHGEMKSIRNMWDVTNWTEKLNKKTINSVKQIIALQRLDLNRKRQRIRSVLELPKHINPFDLLECLIELVEKTARGKVDDVIVNAVKRTLQKDIQEEEEEEEEEENDDDDDDGNDTVGEVIKEVIEIDGEGEKRETTKRLLIVKGKGFLYNDSPIDVQMTQLYDCYYVVALAYQMMMMMYTIFRIPEEELQNMDTISVNYY